MRGLKVFAYLSAVVAIAYSLDQAFAWLKLPENFHEAGTILAFGMFFVFALTSVGVALAALVTVKGFGAGRGEGGLKLSSVSVSICLAVGFLAATPVAGGWDDGCNSHGSVFPAGSIPYLALFTPSDPWGVYEDSHTLKLCLPPGSGGGFSTWSLDD